MDGDRSWENKHILYFALVHLADLNRYSTRLAVMQFTELPACNDCILLSEVVEKKSCAEHALNQRGKCEVGPLHLHNIYIYRPFPENSGHSLAIKTSGQPCSFPLMTNLCASSQKMLFMD